MFSHGVWESPMIQKTCTFFLHTIAFFYFSMDLNAHAAASEDIKEIISRMIISSETCDLTPFVAPKFISYVELYKIYLNMLNKENEIVDGRELLKLSDNAATLNMKRPIRAAVFQVAPSMMADIIKGFFWHQFPHGKPSHKELELLSQIAVELIAKAGMDNKVLDMVNPSYSQYLKDEKFVSNKKAKKDWLSWKPKQIAHAITMRDVGLLWRADFQEMDNYINNQYGKTSVADIFLSTDTTTAWLVYELLKAKDKKRKRIIKHIICIIEELYALNNLHGVMTFALALEKPEVQIIVKGQISKEKVEALARISGVLAPKKYANFLDHLAVDELRLPILNKVFQKLITTEFPKNNPKECDIARLANSFKQVSICKRQSHYKLRVNKYIFEFFKNLPIVPQQTLDNLYYVRSYLKEITGLPSGVANYFTSSVDFAGYLAKHVGTHVIKTLFQADIFTFQDLQLLLSNARSREEKKMLLMARGLNANDAKSLGFLSYLHVN